MDILNTRCDNPTFDEALDHVTAMAAGSSRTSVFFVNFDCLYRASRDEEYNTILKKATLVLPDGIGLKVVFKLFGHKLKDNCNGTDFSPALMARAAEKGFTVFLMGGQPGIAEAAAENIQNKIPGLKVAGTHSGFFKDDAQVIEKINRSGASILLVAMGVPLQEKWIARNRAALKPVVCLGVGALLDFWAQRVKRAPVWMRRSGLEWTWRIAQEPKRLFRRYILEDIPFFGSILVKRFSGREKK